MTCESLKSYLLDYLYDEIDEDNRKIVEAHLKTCEHCQNEFLDLKNTSRTLQQLEPVPSPLNLVFAKETETIWQKLQGFRESLSGDGWLWGRRLGYAFAAILLIFSLANFEISMKDNEFSMKMSLWPRSDTEQMAQTTPAITPAVMDSFKQEINKLILANQEQQRKEWTQNLVNLNREFELKRREDLQLVGNTFNQLQTETQSELQKIKIMNVGDTRVK